MNPPCGKVLLRKTLGTQLRCGGKAADRRRMTKVLPFLSEVAEAQACRRLLFLVVPQAGDHQHHHGDHIRQHLVQLLHGHLAAGGDVQIQDVQAAEQDGGQDTDIGTPDGEDHQGDGQPAAVAESVVGPHAAGVVHHVVQAAETGDHAAHAGGQVLIPGNVDTGGVGGGGAFAHGAQVQAGPGVLQEIGGQQGQDNGQIRQEAIGQENLAEPAQTLGKGQGLGKIAAGGGQGNGGDLTAGELDQGAAEEVADAHAEGGHGQTGNVLVGPQGHRQEAVQQAHQQRAQQGAQHGDQNGQKAAHLVGGHGLLIEERADDAADTAHIHDAGDTQVQIAGLLGEDLAGATVQQGDTLHDRAGDEGYNIKIHFLTPPSFRKNGTGPCS